MRKTIFVVLIALGLLLLTGCATILSGSSDEVTIISSPDNAEVYIDGMRYGYTPVTVTLEKGKTYQVEIRKEGFDSGFATITNKIGVGWVVLDVVVGVLPIVVDIVSDAWYELTPDVINIQLK